MLTLEIANILFAIEGRDCSVRDGYEPAYETFLKGNTITTPDISVDVVVSRLPDISKAKRLFSSESSWFLCSHDGNYYFVLDPPAADDGPLWIARFDASLRTVTIFCNERLAVRESGDLCIPNPLRYPLDQILLMYYLAGKGGAILHAAGAMIKNKGYLFPGRSGAGKSTLARQLDGAARSEVLSDDRVVVRKVGNDFSMFGTPWPGEAGAAVNKAAPLSGIFFISHGGDNRIRAMSGKEALERFLPVTSIPWYDPKRMTDVLIFCEAMISRVPAYEFSFRPDSEMVHVLEEFASR